MDLLVRVKEFLLSFRELLPSFREDLLSGLELFCCLESI